MRPRITLSLALALALALIALGVLSAGRDASRRDFTLVEGRPFDRGPTHPAPLNSDYDQLWYLAAGVVVALALPPWIARRRRDDSTDTGPERAPDR